MLPPPVNGLVGLITIASPIVPAAASDRDATDDATLDQLFERLTCDDRAPRAALGVRRFRGRSYHRSRGELVTADCHTLSEQLERVALRLRHTIAAAHAGGR